MAEGQKFMEDILIELQERYHLDYSQKSPIEIRNVGRSTLAIWLGAFGFNRGVEIGTQTGVFAEMLCKGNGNIDLTCIDPWFRYPEYKALPGENLQENYQIAKKRLSPYNVELMRSYSMDAVKHFEDGSLDFVYIDANHEFEWVINDIIQWSKKV